MITVERVDFATVCYSCNTPIRETNEVTATAMIVVIRLCDRCLAELKSKLCVGMVLPAAHARRTDPDTSRLAARSVNVTKGQRQVLWVIKASFGPVHDFTLDDLVEAAAHCLAGEKWSPSGVRSRCRELVDHGIVVRLGTTRLKSGRSGHVHRLVRT